MNGQLVGGDVGISVCLTTGPNGVSVRASSSTDCLIFFAMVASEGLSMKSSCSSPSLCKTKSIRAMAVFGHEVSESMARFTLATRSRESGDAERFMEEIWK